MHERQQNTTAHPIPFLLMSGTSAVTGLGTNVTVTLAKDGANTFTAASGGVTEAGNGVYWWAGNATDRNTLGSLVAYATGTGAEPARIAVNVLPYDPFAGVMLDGFSAAAKQAFNRLNGVSGSNTFYVSPGGNDTTGDGTISAPYASLRKACLVATNTGSVIKLSPGTYTANFQCNPAAGVTIQGAGPQSTYITSNLLLGSGIPIQLSDNVVVKDLTLENTATSGYAACIGNNDSSRTFVGARLENLNLIGRTDAISMDCSAAFDLTVRNCYVQSQWDTVFAVNTFGATGNVLRLYGSKFYSVGPNAFMGSIANTSTGLQLADTHLYAEDVTIHAEGSSSNTCPVYVAASGGQMVVDLSRTKINSVPGTSGTTYDINGAATGGSIVIRADTQSTYDPAKVHTVTVTAMTGTIPEKLATSHGSGSWLTGSGGTGTGNGAILVDHNTGGTDNLRVELMGSGLPNVQVRAFLQSDWDAGNRSIPTYCKGETVTDGNGRWAAPLHLAAGTYAIDFDGAQVQIPPKLNVVVS